MVIPRAGRGWSAYYKPDDDDSADWVSVEGWYDTPGGQAGSIRCSIFAAEPSWQAVLKRDLPGPALSLFQPKPMEKMVYTANDRRQ